MRSPRILSLPLAVVTVLALAPASLAAAAPPASGASDAPADGTIPGRYIVTLVDGADPAAVAREYRARGAAVDHVYGAALVGFAGAIPPHAVDRLRADARVERVEADGWARATGLTTQTGATWGLDRIDEREHTLDTTYTYETTASGVTAYVIDTGIRASHTEFTGRMAAGYTSIADGNGTDDCNGHGTHVAGTIGGTAYGVAKGVTLVPVRVLNCSGSGTWSGVIAGIDWVTDNAQQPAVANMSLGGGANASVDDAVRRSIGAGVVYALAAGNDDRDACNYSPARVLEGLTVGATTSSDARASYSNHGSCLDLFAPGSGITSAWITGDTSTKAISGTSMATPHVAGAAALHLAAQPSASVAAVNDAVVGNATAGVVSDPGRKSPNLFLHSLSAAPEPVAPAAPSGFTAEGVSSSRIDLTWTDSGDEAGYRITLHDGTTVDVAADTVAHPVDGLTASTAYTFGLQAIGADGLLSTKVEATGTTLAAADDPTGPTAPVASIATDCAGSATCGFDGAASTGDGLTYRWSTGETASAIALTFTSPGNYTVTLTVTDAVGATDDRAATVSCGWSGKGKHKTLVCS